MGKLLNILKNWMLVVGMLLGASLYFIYRELTPLHEYGPYFLSFAKNIQPILLFCMLFLSFCKIAPKDLKFKLWQLWLLIIQGGVYVVSTVAIMLISKYFPEAFGVQINIEAFALCMICPTATACSVLTAKLGGDRAGVMTYTILINFLVALVVPLMVPMIHPIDGLNFWAAFYMILKKVFPLLILPCLVAWGVRYVLPKFHDWCASRADLAFYLWAISLTLAILMSVRGICHSSGSAMLLFGIAFFSLVACVLQFWAGKEIAGKYGDRITGGQVMGQKNTVFAIWMGYTFLDPMCSVAGGFYTIWHNVFNSWQLHRQRHGKKI